MLSIIYISNRYVLQTSNCASNDYARNYYSGSTAVVITHFTSHAVFDIRVMPLASIEASQFCPSNSLTVREKKMRNPTHAVAHDQKNRAKNGGGGNVCMHTHKHARPHTHTIKSGIQRNRHCSQNIL
jgi:hypothetical protein